MWSFDYDFAVQGDPWIEDHRELKNHLEQLGDGIHVVALFDPGDSTFCVFDNGRLKATAYLSSRGVWVAAAYDGHTCYWADNDTRSWAPHLGAPGWILRKIVMGDYQRIKSQLQERSWRKPKDGHS